MAPEYRDDEDSPHPDFPILTDDEADVESQNRDIHVRSASGPSQPSSMLPIWLRESAKTFRFKWVPLPFRKAARAVTRWVKGPVPPVELRIRPFFPSIQEAPLKLLDRIAPKRKHKAILLVAFYGIWFLIWSLMIRAQATSGYIEGYGKPANLWCGASYWSEGNGCGLNGNQCRPFSSAHLAFRCPANCKTTHLLEEHVVGNQSLIFQGLVVGGPKANDPESLPIYRGDSFVCQAAIHAGVIGDEGGCGVVSLVGEHSDFQSTDAHGMKSTAFPASFPRSFTFQKLSGSQAQCPSDSRWGIFAVTAVALVILSVFTTSPAVFFFSTFFIVFLQTGLVSDPPNKANFHELLSTLFGRLLPAAFVAFILYRYCAVPLLSDLRAQVEKTVLYLGMCFIGALNNYTFAILIPIERLTPHDLAQPGARTALAIILTTIVVIIISQIHYIRISGNMPRYLALYVMMGLSLLVFVSLPGQRVRIHHYILALLFMPGTAFKTRPGLIYQGLLLGLFINGVARWGFDSIIQTPAALGESDGGHGGSWWGAKAPNVSAVVAPDASNITFSWGQLPLDTGIDGVSILLNDVERWRGYTDEELFRNEEEVTLKRRKREENEPEFFRFAWVNGASAGRYSKTGVWDEKGSWHPIPAK